MKCISDLRRRLVQIHSRRSFTNANLGLKSNRNGLGSSCLSTLDGWKGCYDDLIQAYQVLQNKLHDPLESRDFFELFCDVANLLLSLIVLALRI